MKKHKIMALILSLAIVFNICGALVYATGTTSKEEVVYINLNSDGSVSEVFVVNIFDVNDEGKIIDYGDYTSLRNMTTNDEIKFDKQTVTIDTKSKKLYYEGKLNSDSIPWLFSIKYFMNDIEYPAEEIAGRSGKLRIEFSEKQNPKCNSTFFEHYALQATVVLDTEKCSNIVADGATVANVGKNKQLVYTILPKKEIDIEITADVEGFEMTGISINGMSLSLDVEVDLANNADIIEMQNGIADLDKGANDIKDGVKEILDGSEELAEKMADLKKGTDDLHDGAKEFLDGTNKLFDGATELNDGAEELKDGAYELETGSKDLKDGAKEIDDGVRDLEEGATDLDNGIKSAVSGAKDIKNGASDLSSGASSLKGGLSELTSKNAEIQQMSNMLFANTLSQASSILTGEYTVTLSTTKSQLEAMMERRLAELADDTHKETATQNAIEQRKKELQATISDDTDEEKENATVAIQFWDMTLVLQGMEKYNQAIAEVTTDEEKVAINSAFATVLTAYQSLLANFDDDPTKLMTAYDNLTTTVGVSEQAIVGKMVTDAITASVGDDMVYKTLAALTYYKGVIEYTNGVATVQSGTNELSSGASALYDGASELYNGLKEIKTGSTELLEGIAKLADGTAELKEGTIELHNGVITLKDGVIGLQSGTQELLDGVVELRDGAIELYDGVVELQDGVVKLLDGAIELRDGAIELHDGCIELTDGTFELKAQTTTANLNDKIKRAINDIMGNDEFETVSFVSDKNQNVKSVQFVAKTPDIEIAEEEMTETPIEKQKTVWEKILMVFGIGD